MNIVGKSFDGDLAALMAALARAARIVECIQLAAASVYVVHDNVQPVRADRNIFDDMGFMLQEPRANGRRCCI
jgi:hypothetical protein